MTAATFPVVPATRLRLTSRGRVVLGTLAAAPVLVAALSLGINAAPAAAGDSSLVGATLSQVTVGAGDSLWSIAEAVAPGHDPRDVIADILKLNGLSSVNVPAGTQLAIPSY